MRNHAELKGVLPPILEPFVQALAKVLVVQFNFPVQVALTKQKRDMGTVVYDYVAVAGLWGDSFSGSFGIGAQLGTIKALALSALGSTNPSEEELLSVAGELMNVSWNQIKTLLPQLNVQMGRGVPAIVSGKSFSLMYPDVDPTVVTLHNPAGNLYIEFGLGSKK